jgi:hypothetical protein
MVELKKSAQTRSVHPEVLTVQCIDGSGRAAMWGAIDWEFRLCVQVEAAQR